MSNEDRALPCQICEKPQPCREHGRTPVTDADYEELHRDVAAALAEQEAGGDEDRALLQRIRAFIEYARYELKPGKAAFPDQFPRQDDADEAMARCDALADRLATKPISDEDRA